QIFNVKVNSGDRLAECIYDGVRVDLSELSEFCDAFGPQNELEPIWIFAPSAAWILPVNSFHWALHLESTYDFNGDVWPAYSIFWNPYYFRCAKIPAGTVWNPENCLFAAKLIEPDLSGMTEPQSACDITDTEIEDILVYLHLDDISECVSFPHDKFL